MSVRQSVSTSSSPQHTSSINTKSINRESSTANRWLWRCSVWHCRWLLMICISILTMMELDAQIDVSATTQNDIVVCETESTSSFTIQVLGDFTGDLTVDYTLPAGVLYIDASAVVSGDGSLNTQSGGGTGSPQIVVSPDGGSWAATDEVTITITREAGCAAVGEGNQQDAISVSGAPGGPNDFTTATYNVDEASLALALASPVLSTTLGANACRAVTISQGGNGYITTLTHVVTVGADLPNYTLSFGGTALTATNTTVNMDGSTTFEYTIDLTMAPFTTAAGGNGQFENGEDIELEECFDVDGCSQSSAFTMHASSWGCTSEFCQTTPSANGFVDVPVVNPSLTVTRGFTPEACFFGEVTTQTINIANGAGAGTASNISLFFPGFAGQNSNMVVIDTSSFSYQIIPAGGGAPGPATSVSADNFVITTATSSPIRRAPIACLNDGFMAHFDVATFDAGAFPDLEPGATLVFTYEYIICCPTDQFCNEPFRNNRWVTEEVNVNYTDACGNARPRIGAEITPNVPAPVSPTPLVEGPAALAENETGTFCYTTAQFAVIGNTALSPDSYYEVVVTLPDGLDYVANTLMTQYAGGTWTPVSEVFDAAANTLTIRYDAADAPASLANRSNGSLQICYDLINTCSANLSGVQSINTLGQFHYEPNGCSDCVADMQCVDRTIVLICTIPCPEGGSIAYLSEAYRENLGLTDADDDACADDGSTADRADVRDDRLVAGDTLYTNYCVAIANGTEGNNPFSGISLVRDLPSMRGATIVSSEVSITLADGTMYNAPDVPPTMVTEVAPDRTEEYVYTFADLATLAGSDIPSTLMVEEGDSICITVRYEVPCNANTTDFNYIEQSIMINNFALSNASADLFTCVDIPVAYTLIGISTAANTGRYVFSSCTALNTGSGYFVDYLAGPNTAATTQQYFPNEVRELFRIDTIIFTVANYLDISNVRLQTRVNGVVTTSPVLSPSSTSSSATQNVFNFDVAPLYADGTFKELDEAFRLELLADFQLNCTVPEGGNPEFGGALFFKPFVDQVGTDKVQSRQANRSVGINGGLNTSITALPPELTAFEEEVCWTARYSNNSGSLALENTYMTASSISGNITVSSVSLGGTPLMPNADGLYELGTVAAGGNVELEICGIQNVCQRDSLQVGFGFDCAGYPTAADVDACRLETIDLIVNPSISQIQLQITDQPAAAVDLCDPFTMEVTINSAQVGDLINPRIQVDIPAGLMIDSNTVEYPAGSGNYETLIPVPGGGNSYIFQLTEHTLLTGDSLPGVNTNMAVPPRQVVLELEFLTDCDFNPNSTIGFTALAERPCTEPADGSGEVTASGAIQVSGATTYDAAPSLTLNSNIDLFCESTFPVTVTQTIVGGTTGSRDSAYLYLPADMSYDSGSLMCSSPDGSDCPTFIEEIPDPNSTGSIVKFAYPSGIDDGDQIVYTFDVAVSPSLSCGLSSELRLENRVTLDPLTCGMMMCANPVEVITGGATAQIEVEKPVFSIAAFTATTVGPPVNDTITYDVSVTVANDALAADAPAGTALEFYCLDMSGDPIGAPIYAALLPAVDAGDSTTLAITIAHDCDISQGFGVVIQDTTDQFSPAPAMADTEQCLCAETTLVPADITQAFDVALRKSLAVGEVGPWVPGDTVTFSIEVFNQGTLDADSLVITDYIPTGMTNIDMDWTGNVYSITDLSAGDSITIDIDLRIDDTYQGDTLSNNAEITYADNALGTIDKDDDIAMVTGSSDDTSGLATDDDIDDDGAGTPGMADNPSDADDYDIAQIGVSQTFDVALRKGLAVGEVGPWVPGDTVTFSIEVFNQGTLDADSLVITDYVPTGMTNIDMDWTGNVYSITDLAAGDSVTIDIDLRIDTNYQGDTLSNNAEITYAENALDILDEDGDIADIMGSSDDTSGLATDDDIDDDGAGTPGTADNPSDADDYDIAQIGVSQTFDVALRKGLAVGEVGPFNAGDTVTFSIEVFNQGTLDADSLVITDYIPTGMTNIDMDWMGNLYSITDLSAGDSITIDIDLRIDDNYQGDTLSNNAEITYADNALGIEDEDGDIAMVTGSTDDTSGLATDDDIDDDGAGTPGTMDNAADADDYDISQIGVTQTFDVALRKGLSVSEMGPWVPGDTVTFSIEVFNQGTLDADSLVITDYIPTGMTNIDMDWMGNLYSITDLAAGDSITIDIDLQIDASYQGDTLSNNAEITYADNALGIEDEDGDIAMVTGSSDDTSGLATDDDIDDDGVGTPGTMDNAADADDYDISQIGVTQTFDVALRKGLAVGEVGPWVPGDTVTFSIEVFNQGTLDADSLVITDYIPTGMTNIDMDWTGNVYSITDLSAGDSVTIDIDLRIDANYQGDTLSNNAEITYADNALGIEDEDGDIAMVTGSTDDTSGLATDDDIDDDGAGTPGTMDNAADADDYDISQIGVTQTFDVALRTSLSTVEMGPFAAGDTVTFSIEVFNQGTLDADSLVITDYIPTGMTNIDMDWMGNLYSITDLAAGDSITIDIDLLIDTNYQGDTLSNNAEITYAENALDIIDEDDDIANVTGSSDDTSELATDDDIDDDGAGTPGTMDNAADADDYDISQIGVTQTFDVALRKGLAVGEVGPWVPGDTVTFSIEVFNQGTLDADSLVITDYIPTGMTNIDMDWMGNVYSITDLAAGDSITIDIDLQIDANYQGDTLSNNAEITYADNALGIEDEDGDIAMVTGSTDDTSGLATDDDIDDDGAGTPGTADNPSDADDYDIAQIGVSQTFDVALRKGLAVGEVGPFNAGDTVTFSIEVFNQGTLDADSLVITDYIPTGMTNIDMDWTGNVYSITDLSAGDSVTIDIDLRIDNNYQGDTLSNNAEITYAENALDILDEDGDIADVTGSSDDTSGLATDDDIDDDGAGTPGTADNPSDADDYDIAQIGVSQTFDVALRKGLAVGEVGPFNAGDTVTFSIEVFNQGTLDADSLVITDYIPTGMTNIDMDWMGNLYSITDLAAGDSITIDIDLRIDDNYQGDTLSNNAEISYGENALDIIDEDDDISNVTGSSDDTSGLATDDDIDDDGAGTPGTADNPSDADDYDIAQIGVSQTFDVALRKGLAVGEVGPFNAGDTVTFSIEVFNQGTLDADSLVITDYIPTGMTNIDMDWTGNVYSITDLAAGDSITIDIDLLIDTNYQGDTLSNNAEITYAENALDIIDEDDDIANVTGSSDDTSGLATDDDIDDDGVGTPGTMDNAADADDYDISQIGVTQEFDLALRKQLAITETGPFKRGDTLTFTIHVFNQGTIDAEDVTIREYVPVGMANIDMDWAGDQYTIDSLAAGDSIAVEIDLRIDMSYQGGALINNAEIIAADNLLDYTDEDGDLDDIDGSIGDDSELDSDDDIDDEAPGTPGTMDNPMDHDDYDATNIEIVDLAMVKSVIDQGSLSYGDTVSFVIDITNQGSVPVTDILINDYVPSGFQFIPGINDGWQLVSNVYWDSTYQKTVEDTLLAGLSISDTIRLRLLQSDDSADAYTNIAEISGLSDTSGIDLTLADLDSPGDDDPFNDPGGSSDTGSDDTIDGDGSGMPGDDSSESDEDNSDPVKVEIVDFAIKKTTPSEGPYFVGTPVPYTITIYNQGNVINDNITIYDYIPTGLDYINDVMVNPGWSTVNDSTLTFTYKDPILPGDSANILVYLAPNGTDFSTGALTNIAEIGAVLNSFNVNIGLSDVDSKPDDQADNDTGGLANGMTDNTINNENDDEDDADPAMICAASLSCPDDLNAVTAYVQPYTNPSDAGLMMGCPNIDVIFNVQDSIVTEDCSSGNFFSQRQVIRTYSFTTASNDFDLECEQEINLEFKECNQLTDYGTVAIDGESILMVPNGCSVPIIAETAAVQGGGSSSYVEYMWLVSTAETNGQPVTPSAFNMGPAGSGADWEIIPDALSPDYTPGVITQNTYFVRCARDISCCAFGESNIVGYRIDDTALCPVVQPLPQTDDCDNDIILNQANNMLNAQEMEYRTNRTISASNRIAQQAKLIYNAKLGTTLEQGFEVDKSAQLEVKSSGCDNND